MVFVRVNNKFEGHSLSLRFFLNAKCARSPIFVSFHFENLDSVQKSCIFGSIKTEFLI